MAQKKSLNKINQTIEIFSLQQLSHVAMTFWIGGTLTIGTIVVPILFKMLDEITASTIAGQIFNINAYTGIVAIFFALIEICFRHKLRAIHLRKFWYAAIMEIILFINYFAIFPIIEKIKVSIADVANHVFRHSTEFNLWHSASSILFLLSMILGVLYLVEK